MTTAVATDYSDLIGKDVIVHYTEDGDLSEEVIGKLEIANANGILVKVRGKGVAKIISPGEIQDVEVAPEREKKVKVRYLDYVTVDNAKAHLADRHGAQVKQLNGMTSKEAFDWHATFDHEALDLAHRHGEKPKRTAATTSEAAPQEPEVTPDAEV